MRSLFRHRYMKSIFILIDKSNSTLGILIDEDIGSAFPIPLTISHVINKAYLIHNLDSGQTMAMDMITEDVPDSIIDMLESDDKETVVFGIATALEHAEIKL